MALNAGTVKEYIADPPNAPDPRARPDHGAHRRNVLDPMTARSCACLATAIPSCRKPASAGSDFRRPHALRSAVRLQAPGKVKSEKGYPGTVVVCAVYFTPVAGHIPDRPCVKYLNEAARHRDLARADRRHARDGAVPYLAADPARAGIVQATQFVGPAGRAPRRLTGNGGRSHDAGFSAD